MSVKINKFSVYFVNSLGYRDGVERITAQSKEDAVNHYRNFFNVNDQKVNAIPVYERKR